MQAHCGTHSGYSKLAATAGCGMPHAACALQCPSRAHLPCLAGGNGCLGVLRAGVDSVFYCLENGCNPIDITDRVRRGAPGRCPLKIVDDIVACHAAADQPTTLALVLRGRHMAATQCELCGRRAAAQAYIQHRLCASLRVPPAQLCCCCPTYFSAPARPAEGAHQPAPQHIHSNQGLPVSVQVEPLLLTGA